MVAPSTLIAIARPQMGALDGPRTLPAPEFRTGAPRRRLSVQGRSEAEASRRADVFRLFALIPTKRHGSMESPSRGRRPIRWLNRAECSARSKSGVGLHRHIRPSDASDSDG